MYLKGTEHDTNNDIHIDVTQNSKFWWKLLENQVHIFQEKALSATMEASCEFEIKPFTWNIITS